MNAKQRRMWVLPAPDGRIDRWDRYAIGIFYSFGAMITQLLTPAVTFFASGGNACPSRRKC